MYAVIALGGKQYRVIPGETLVVDRLPHEEGATFSPQVLMASDGKKTVFDADGLAKVKVEAEVRLHMLGKKIRIFTYKAKHMQSKRKGHRSKQSVIAITKIAV